MSDALPRIRSLRPAPGQRLEITWETGQHSTVDLSGHISGGGVFAPLRDRRTFATARLDTRHRVVEWVNPTEPGTVIVDIDADTLQLLGRQQSFGARLARLLQPQKS